VEVPPLADLIEGILQGSSDGFERIGVGVGENPQIRVVADLVEKIGPGFRGAFTGQGESAGQGAGGVELDAPEVLGDLLEERGGIGDQLHVEEHPALEGIVAKDPVAEAVDGEDLGLVEVEDGGFEFTNAFGDFVLGAGEEGAEDGVLRLALA